MSKLDSGAPVAGLTLSGLSPPPMPPPAAVDERIEVKRVVGWSLAGAGVLTAATGGVFAGIAATRAAANRPDASGAVTVERAEGAALALRHEEFAAVLIPAGAALAAVGALVTFWPSSNAAAVGLTVTPAGAVVSGALPCVCDPTSCPDGCGTSAACATGNHCAAGKCVCDATTCPSGCCSNGVCTSLSLAACGAAGAACKVCSPLKADTCSSLGACVKN